MKIGECKGLEVTQNIRNIAIIAHIDHGKSTLSDRFIEICGGVSKRLMEERILDSMDLEKERGITIKLNNFRLSYKEVCINLIDTPGHTDFNYEVSRSLAACEGVILLVDATRGVQAQTISNYALAKELTVIPVINKVDSPVADVEGVLKQLNEQLGIDSSKVLRISAKTGIGCSELLDKVVELIPSPKRYAEDGMFRGLIFDSYYDKYRGAIIFFKVVSGLVKVGDRLRFLQTNLEFEISELGVKERGLVKLNSLTVGEIGWMCGGIRTLKEVCIGDTLVSFDSVGIEPLPGFSKSLPMVYASLFPVEGTNYETFRSALEKVSLSDSSLVFELETSTSFGFGARCGFLGLLHVEIIKERLKREFEVGLVVTKPSVKYFVELKNGKSLYVSTPSLMPPVNNIEQISEPHVLLSITTPEQYVGAIMKLCEEFDYQDMTFSSPRTIIYSARLSCLIMGFYDHLKSVSNGYASMSYEDVQYKTDNLVRVDLLVNGQAVDALSFICLKKESQQLGKEMVTKMKENIPKQLFEVPVQATISGKVISRETIKAVGKNVTAKCYGGDISRKRKLWENQKKGKKKMKSMGRVMIPHSIFEKFLSK